MFNYIFFFFLQLLFSLASEDKRRGQACEQKYILDKGEVQQGVANTCR